jgi:pyruvate ferredoxin oxidoreductase alpha subunit
VLTHAFEEVDLPDQGQVDAFLPRFTPRQVLDPHEPVSIGAMVGPEAFTEVKYLMHARHLEVLDRFPAIAEEFCAAFGRDHGLVRGYRLEGASTVVVTLGSVLGTVEEVVDGLRDEGEPVGALGVTCFRPWPAAEVRRALAGAERVLVVERAFSVGVGGIVAADVRDTLRDLPARVYGAVAGLGGRPVTRTSLRGLLGEVLEDRLDPDSLHFLDLDAGLVRHELEAQR